MCFARVSLKLSNRTACNCIHSDSGNHDVKYVIIGDILIVVLFAMIQGIVQ